MLTGLELSQKLVTVWRISVSFAMNVSRCITVKYHDLRQAVN